MAGVVRWVSALLDTTLLALSMLVVLLMAIVLSSCGGEQQEAERQQRQSERDAQYEQILDDWNPLPQSRGWTTIETDFAECVYVQGRTDDKLWCMRRIMGDPELSTPQGG